MSNFFNALCGGLRKLFSLLGAALGSLFSQLVVWTKRVVRKHPLWAGFITVGVLFVVFDGVQLITSSLYLVVMLLALGVFVYGIKKYVFGKK